MKSIIIIVDYFNDKWPEWFPVYFESIRQNPTIHWHFHTDCDCDSFKAENADFHHISREDYIEFVSDKLGVKFAPHDNHKLCDIRPMYGILYENEIGGYDLFGYGDIDVIYGNIRQFYTDEVLENNIISTHTWCFSGHFTLVKNERWLRNAFRRVRNWKSLIEQHYNQRFDEDKFFKLFKYPKFLPVRFQYIYDLLNPEWKKYRSKLYLKEQFTTPLTPSGWIDNGINHPTVWFWKNGRITNETDGDREFIYFHFMNFKNARYMDAVYGKTAFWSNLPQIVHLSPEEYKYGIRIDRYGFHKMDDLL